MKDEHRKRISEVAAATWAALSDEERRARGMKIRLTGSVTTIEKRMDELSIEQQERIARALLAAGWRLEKRP